MEKYIVLQKIGSGHYGHVYWVKCRETGDNYALKCHQNNADDNGVSESTVRELSCLSALRGHPNIVEMLDCFLYNGQISSLMPYLPLTLFDVMYRTWRGLSVLPIPYIARSSLEIANALSYMHGLNMVHRDLKPENVLLTADTLTVKVADMGLSRYAIAKGMSSTVVTEPYRAPELFVNGCIVPYTCAVDMWSLGVMIVDAMEAKVAFYDPKIPTDKFIAAALDPELSESDNYPSRKTVMPNVMRHKRVSRIVFKLLQMDPKKRLTARSLLADGQWRKGSRVTPDIISYVKQCVVNARWDK
ncbi:cyclin-dependent kinase 2-like [Oreochromis aureus]|uniref:cyclin-dependent kinase 2-like n=1 Tax=Oreochromis aureus TaxID=47969 RepID=UPI0012BCF83A|nr:cyclin-dependent kinase 2-like [Oreochromis aureus]CAI5654298.1 unnamed protein product [Mustela putorius furo]